MIIEQTGGNLPKYYSKARISVRKCIAFSVPSGRMARIFRGMLLRSENPARKTRNNAFSRHFNS